jgi:hypothetical protein
VTQQRELFEAVGPSYDVHVEPVWGSVCCPEQCNHDGPNIIVINGRIEDHRLACDAAVCMRCGTDTTGQVDLFWALQWVVRDWKWNRRFVERCFAIAKVHRAWFIAVGAVVQVPVGMTDSPFICRGEAGAPP